MNPSTSTQATPRLHALRLVPGDDLRKALLQAVHAEGLSAACILGAVGSLSIARLRFADQPEGTRIEGPLELLSLSGTLGSGGCHLHASVSDARGQVSGGHVLDGCLVRTTAEVVMAEIPGLVFSREFDPLTGYRELLIHSLPQGGKAP